jgi:hypothetical protein
MSTDVETYRVIIPQGERFDTHRWRQTKYKHKE